MIKYFIKYVINLLELYLQTTFESKDIIFCYIDLFFTLFQCAFRLIELYIESFYIPNFILIYDYFSLYK